MRLIDADRLLSERMKSKYYHLPNGDIAIPLIDIEHAPTIEERKTGRWIYGENDGQDGWYCSECEGFIPWDYDFYGLNNIDFIKDFKTCPFCDSKMISCTGSENMER